ncbi:hypothetical protein FAVG1_08955 [Fusarium avenaceum]|nr:hypothetical protein FAVG1_08955 [Fusarium avenaceum]
MENDDTNSEANLVPSGFGLTPAPNIEPESSLDWPDFEHPELATVGETVLSGQLRFVARQNQAVLNMVQNLYTAISKSQSRRSSMSSTAASDKTGDEPIDLTVAGGDGQQVIEAFNALISDAFRAVLSRFHADFVEINSKKLYVTRTLTSGKDAQAYLNYVTQTIEDKQADPAGQEDMDLVEQQDQILSNLKALTPDLVTDLYIYFNKAKKETEHPKTSKKGKTKGKSKGKGKQVEAPPVSGDEDYAHSNDGDENHHHNNEGEASSGRSKSKSTSGLTTSRQPSNTSQGSDNRRTTRLTSRQISRSSAITAEASQHSQASATTTERRRSKQRTRFIISDDEDDDEN